MTTISPNPTLPITSEFGPDPPIAVYFGSTGKILLPCTLERIPPEQYSVQFPKHWRQSHHEMCVLRSANETLSKFDDVYIVSINKHRVFLVIGWYSKRPDANIDESDIPLSIEDIPVHVKPSPGWAGQRYSGPGWLCTPLFDLEIDPTKHLESYVRNEIRYVFPSAVGVRLYMFGAITLLFGCSEEVKRIELQEDLPPTIGQLPYTLEVDDVKPLTGPSRPKTNSQSRVKPLGAKIRLPSGDVAWTMSTHSCVDPRSKAIRIASDMVFWVPRKIQGWCPFMLPTRPRYIDRQLWAILKYFDLNEAYGLSSSVQGGGALGKSVTSEDSDSPTQIGTVSRIFDEPDIFPSGYAHDLALVTGPSFPCFNQPGNRPPFFPSFASPEEALDAECLYIVGSMDGVKHSESVNTQPDGVIAGTEERWGPDGRITTSLIWRRVQPTRSSQGTELSAAGQLICSIHRDTDGLSRSVPLLFQNYEVQTENGLYFQGGFVLPEEVQRSTLEVDGLPATSDTGNRPASQVDWRGTSSRFRFPVFWWYMYGRGQ